MKTKQFQLGVVCAACLFAIGAVAAPAKKPKAAVKKKAAAGKAYDYERSKYKSRELSENTSRYYRFNERGEPISPDKKTPASQSKREKAKPASSAAVCGEDSCQSDRDAL